MIVWDSVLQITEDNTGLQLELSQSVGTMLTARPHSHMCPKCSCMRDEGFRGSGTQTAQGRSPAHTEAQGTLEDVHAQAEGPEVLMLQRASLWVETPRNRWIMGRWQEASKDSINEMHQEAKSPWKL